MFNSTVYRRPLFLVLIALLVCTQLTIWLPHASGAPAVIATISVGGYPIDAGVNPITNRIYVANTTGDSVAVVDGSTNAVITTVTVGDAPYAVDANTSTNTIYTANYSSNNVSVIDGTSNTVTATVGVGSAPYAIDVNSTTNRIYVVNQTGNSLSVIDGSSNTVIATVPVGNRPGGVAVNSTTNRIYVANANSNNVSVIDGSTNTVIATVPVGSGSEGIDLNPVTNRIYVANQWQYTVSVIDGSTNTVTATVTLGNMNNQGVGVNSATNRIYVSSFYNGRVNVIDGSTNTATANLGVGSGPWGVGVNPSTSRIYVGNSNGGNVSVIYDPFNITASAGAGGSISPSGDVGVNPGASQAFTIAPSTGYHVLSVFADGVYQGTPAGYTFTNVDANHSISAQFAINTYTVSTSISGGHGNIQGAQSVNYNDSASVAITPDAGYHIATITDNGAGQTVANPYVISNVTAAHNVVVTFAINTYQINASVYYTGHGSVSPATQTVNYGATANIDLIPEAGYHPVYIIDNGAPATVADPYVISSVAADHQVIVSFDPDTYPITASASAGGNISPSGTVLVSRGSDKTFGIVPDAQYHVADVLVDGSSVGALTSYTFAGVTAGHTISVSFALDSYAVNAAAPAGGGIAAPATQSVNRGGVATINLTPEVNHHIASITDNGQAVPVSNPYIINDVTEAHDVVVAFALDTSTWYLAEGCTAGGTETWILVENINPNPVTLDISFATAEGLFAPSALQGYELAAGTRASFDAGSYIESYQLSTMVTSTGGSVVCERAMYGNDRQWATESVGTDTPATTWYLAEGSTGEGFETWVLVQNPGISPVTVDLTLMTGSGLQAGPQGVSIPAHSRTSFKLNDYVIDYNVSTMVTSTGGGVVCERAMYGNDRIWGTDSIGATSPATTWYLAEGSTGEGFETWVLVQNPGISPVTVDLTLMTGSGPEAGPQDVTIPADSRTSFKLNDYVTDFDVSTKVTATGGGVVCERAMYDTGRTWGTDSIGYAP